MNPNEMTREELIAEVKSLRADARRFRDEGHLDALAEAQATVERQKSELANWQARFDNAQNAICSYCGHQTNRAGKSPEEFNIELLDHIIACEKRPENGMLRVIYSLGVCLGVELDAIPKDNPPQGIIDAFDAAWRKICDGRDALKAENTRLASELAEAQRALEQLIEERDEAQDAFDRAAALLEVETEYSNLRGCEEILEDMLVARDNGVGKTWYADKWLPLQAELARLRADSRREQPLTQLSPRRKEPRSE